MASLESLSNPVERFAVLPQVMNLNRDPQTASADWIVTRQYYQNDVVISPLDGAAYILNWTAGGDAYKGGVDPSLDGGVHWMKFAANGINTYDYLNPTFTTGAGPVFTPTGTTNVFSAVGGSEWLVQIYGTATANPAPLAAGDVLTLTLTPNGTAATPSIVNLLPFVGAAATNFGYSTYVAVPSDGTSITATFSAVALTNAQNLAIKFVFTRLY